MSEKQGTVSRLSVTDWTGQKRAEISGEMEPNTTKLSEITRKAVEALDLPQNTPYSLFRHAPNGRDDEKLNQLKEKYKHYFAIPGMMGFDKTMEFIRGEKEAL